MPESALRHAGALTLAVLLALTAGGHPAADERTTRDGVFTAEQVNRGATIYTRDCAICHAANLAGGEAGPALVGGEFVQRWADRPLYELYALTRDTMPVANPGGLGASAYADVLAYMLRANGYPSSAQPLPTSAAELAAIRTVPPDPAMAAAARVAAADAAPATRRIDADWRHHRNDPGNAQYSPLELINRDNVHELEIVWRWSARNFGPQPEFNYQVTPLMVDGVLYATAGLRRAAVAIDAVTGETLWMHRLDEGERGSRAPRINSGRGLAYWEDGDERRVLYVTPGYHLVALNAATGLPVAGFGNGGIVDLKQGLDQDVDPINDAIGLTSPPIVVNDTVVVGAAFGPGGAPPSKEYIAGHVRGYDVRTGERRWIFHTVPQPGQYGHDTWEDGSAEYTGHTGAWAPLSADPGLGHVYVPVEAPTHDMYGGHRPGDNLFSGSIVALDAETGERVWHFQTVRHDIWDYDLTAAPIVADLTVDGETVPAVIQLTKQSMAFTFNRVTGEPVWPIEDRPVPRSDVPGERAAATQPFPTRPPPFDRQGIDEDLLIDFTPEIREEALRIVSDVRMGPIYTPPSLYDPEGGNRGTLFMPGFGGGANWQGGAFDPETGILYVPSISVPALIGLVHDPARSDMDYVMAGQRFEGPFGLPLVRPPWGRITAIDMNRGEHLWMKANADTPEWVRGHEKLQGVELPRTGHRERGGLLVTKSLLFAGEGAGLFVSPDGGPMFRAHDKLTGEILFEYELPAHQSGMPMTYAIDGRQYIVVPVGARGHPAEFIALSVPEGS